MTKALVYSYRTIMAKGIEDIQSYVLKMDLTYEESREGTWLVKGLDGVDDFVRSILTDNSREHFVALYLDGANQVASYSIVSSLL